MLAVTSLAVSVIGDQAILMMKRWRWEYETGASGKHLKSRSDLTVGNDKYAGTSSFWDKPSFELYNES